MIIIKHLNCHKLFFQGKVLKAMSQMKIIHTMAVLFALLFPISSYAQTGNFFQDLAKGLEDISKGLESIGNPQSGDGTPQQNSPQNTPQSNQNSPPNKPQPIPSKETVPVKFKNSTGQQIIAFKASKPEDTNFGGNLITSSLPPDSTFEYLRDKQICVLDFFVQLSNKTQREIMKVDVCKTDLVNIDSSNFVRSRSARMDGTASTLQSNLGPRGNLTVAINVMKATPGCGNGNRLNIPKSGWNVDFDNNYVVKLRAKNPERYGLWDIYGVTFTNTFQSTNNSAPVALSFLCAE
jgi:hypothetical protein